MPAQQSPTPANTQNKKVKVGKTPAPPQYQEDTVQKCLYWPEPEPPKPKGKAAGKKGAGRGKAKKSERDESQPPPPQQPAPVQLPQSPEVGRPRVRGFKAPTPPPTDHTNDDTAIKALRGWSDSQPEEEHKVEASEFKEPPPEETKEQGKKKKGTAAKNKKGEEGKKGIMSEYDADVSMGDVLSYRFGNEEAEKRFKQQEKEQAKRERAEATAAESKKAMRKVKHTQASMARTNKNIEKVTAVEQDLWKMSKFKNAEPAIDTRRKGGGKGSQDKGDKGGGGDYSQDFGGMNGYGSGEGMDGMGGGCTCHHGEYYRALEDDFAEVNLGSPNAGAYISGGYGVGNQSPMGGYQAGGDQTGGGYQSPCGGILKTEFQSPIGGNQINGGYPSPGIGKKSPGGYQSPVGGYQVNGGYQSPVGGYQMNGGYQSPVGGYQVNGGYQSPSGGYQVNGGYQGNGGYQTPPPAGSPAHHFPGDRSPAVGGYLPDRGYQNGDPYNINPGNKKGVAFEVKL